MYEIVNLDKDIERLLEDQRNIVELELSIKKLKFRRKKKPGVKVLES